MVVFRTRNDVLVRTSDGRNFVIQENIDIARDDGATFRVPFGATTDGASTPREMWSAIPPFGQHWLACVVHDACYRGTILRETVDGQWIPAMLSKSDSDVMLLDCLSALGVEQVLKEAIYEGVVRFAAKAFRDDRTSAG